MARDQGDRLIGDHLEAVRAALWRSVLLKNLLFLCGGLLATVLCFAIIDQWLYSFGMVARSVWIVALLAGATWWIVTRIVPLIRLRVSPEYAAYSVEMDEPEFKYALTSYVTLRNDRDAPGLRGIVVRSIGARAAKHLTTSGMSMPTETLGNFRPGLFAAMMFAALVLYAVLSPKNTAQSISRLAAPLAEIAPPARVTILDVTPGDTESLYGRSIEVSAKIDGLRQSDKPVISLSGPVQQTISLSQQEDSKIFAGSIPAAFVNDSFQYEIIAGDATSPQFNVKVRDEPTVNISEVQYNPHPYTMLAPRTSSIGAISGLEGTRVTIIASTNRQIVRGRIEFNPREIEERTAATAGFAALDISDDGRTVSASWNLRSARTGGGRAGGGQLDIDSYRLCVWDDTDTPNSDPIQFPIQVECDLAPEIRITLPANWPKDVPLGTEQLVEVRAVDPDFGLAKVELRIRRGTRLLETIELLESQSGERGNQLLTYEFSPDLLGLMIGDLVTIEAVAYDNRTNIEGNQPEPNVVVSDPIELKVVEPPAPSDLVNDGDGLKKKMEQPQSEQEEQQQEKSAQEGQEDGKSQSGQGGEQQQGGGGSSEGEAGEKGEGQGSGGQSSDQPQSGENQSGESGSGENQADSQGGGADSASQSGSGGEQTAEPQNTDPNGGGASGGQQQPAGADSSQSEAADAADSNRETATSKSDQNSGQTAGPGGQNGDRDPNQQPNSTQQANSDGQPSSGQQPNSRSQQGSGQGGGRDQSPASSDGEAIERIRDYLNQKQESEKDAGKADNQPENGSKSEQAGSNGRQGDKANSDSKAQPDAGQNGQSSEGPSSEGQSGDPDKQAADEKAGAGADSKQSSGSSPSPNPASTPQSASSNNSQPNATSSDRPSDSGAAQSGKGDSQQDQQNSSDSPALNDAGAKEVAEGDSTPQQSRSQESKSQGGPSGQTGEQEAGESADGNSDQSGSRGSGKSDSSPKPPSQRDSTTENGQQSDAGQPTQESGNSSAQTGSQSNASPPKDPAGADASESASGSAIGNNSSGEQMPSGSRPGPSDAPQAPDPVDVEAAKKATDLVLDSLKNQRENPDQDLLDRLGWTPDQLRNFVDRWEKTRSLGEQNDPAAQRQYEESLKSLGIRPPGTSGPRKSIGRNDQLKDVQDTGQRMAAPPQFRDAIEAYRRSLGSESADK